MIIYDGLPASGPNSISGALTLAAEIRQEINKVITLFKFCSKHCDTFFLQMIIESWNLFLHFIY
jgi:hypothetical protein